MTNLLPLSEVERIVGRKKSSIYADKTFPKPVKVGRNNRWVSSEISNYVDHLVAQRDAAHNLRSIPIRSESRARYAD